MRHDDGGHRFPLRWGAGEGGREQTLQPRPKGRCWVADEREDGGSVLALHSLPSALTLVRLLEVSSLLSPSSPLPSSQKRPQEVLVPGLQPRSRGATSTPLPPSPGDFLRRPCLPASLGAPSRAWAPGGSPQAGQDAGQGPLGRVQGLRHTCQLWARGTDVPLPSRTWQVGCRPALPTTARPREEGMSPGAARCSWELGAAGPWGHGDKCVTSSPGHQPPPVPCPKVGRPDPPSAKAAADRGSEGGRRERGRDQVLRPWPPQQAPGLVWGCGLKPG